MLHTTNKLVKNRLLGRILLIEDNPGDIRLAQEAIKETGDQIELKVLMDGSLVMNYLRQHESNTLPDLILLDLNLPKTNGLSLLKEIKNDPILKRIPVMVLTISQAEEDILQCYNNYANCYAKKPFDIDSFMQLIKSIINFWFNIVTLPRKKEEQNG